MTATSTSNKIFLLLIAAVTLISFTSASHNTGIDTGFNTPDFDSHAEIITLLVAPFIFVTLLLQMTLNIVLRNTIGRGGTGGADPNYRKFSTVMALAITAMLVPSPFWQYIILAGDGIGVVAVSILLFMFLFIFFVVVRGANNRVNNNRYGHE